MAEYMLEILSNELSTNYYYYYSYVDAVGETTDSRSDAFTFPLPKLEGAKIHGISITAPVKATGLQGGYGDFLLKLDNQQIGKWTDSNTTTWDNISLNIDGGNVKNLTLELNPTSNKEGHKVHYTYNTICDVGRTFGQATATIYITADSLIVLTSPTDGASFARSAEVKLQWDTSMIESIGVLDSQSVKWRYKGDSNFNTIYVSPLQSYYKFPSNFFSTLEDTIEWYVEAYDKYNNKYTSNTQTFKIVNDFTLTAKSPSDWSKVSKGTDVKLEWSNSLIEKGLSDSQTIVLKNGGVTQYINVGANDTSYVLNTGSLETGTVSWYIRAWDTSGAIESSNVLNFQITDNDLITISSPSDYKEYLRSETIQFKWSSKMSGVLGYWIQYTTDDPGDPFAYWEKLAEIGSHTTIYETSAAKFKDGTFYWRIYGYASEYAVYSNIGTFKVQNDFIIEPIFPIDGDEVSSNSDVTVSWNNTSIGSVKVVEQILNYRKPDSSYDEIVLTNNETSYTFPANFFENGYFWWYVECHDDYSYTTSFENQTVIVGITPKVEISYPNDINIRNTTQQIFTWSVYESVVTGQKSYELSYKKIEDSEWTVITNESNKQYHVFDAETIDTGEYEWKVRVTNNDGITSEYAYALFTAVGITDAPVVTEVSNSAVPTIYWTIESQDTFELEIYDAGKRIYTSGVQVGYEIREFTPNIMLADGNYIVRMRSMNEYGFFTEWTEYGFFVHPELPDKVECIAYANFYHGINITIGEGITEQAFVIRRKYGETEWKLLGKLKDIYTDNTVLPNVKYEYAIRNLGENKGFIDSNIVSMIIDYDGCYIYRNNEFVQLYKTESSQFEITHTPIKTYSYSNTIGRKYPVRESSEWESHTTNISCFVTFEEYEKLEDFYNSNESLWFKGKNFTYKCAIDSISITETLLGKGYSLSIAISRTDEDEVEIVEKY